MKSPKIDNSGTEAATRANAAAQEAANNLRKNFSADLSTENLTQVTAGGGANALADSLDVASGRKRRTSSGGMSTTLGIG